MPLRRAVLSLVLLAVPALSLPLAAPDIFVAYPPEGHRVAFDHVILEGSVTPGAQLRIGGRAVPVGEDGLFMLWWPLQPGVNDLRLTATLGDQTGTRTLHVIRTAAAPLPAAPTRIDPQSVMPRELLEFWDAAGDTPEERTVTVAFRGSPGGQAAFRVADGPLLPMDELGSGQYEAAYVLPPSARLVQAPITVTLTGRDGQTATATAPGFLSSTGGGPLTGMQRPGTVRGLGLNDANNAVKALGSLPFLSPRDGMTFTLVGRQGRDLRARLAPGVSVLVSEGQLDILPGMPCAGVGGAVKLERAPSLLAATPAFLPADDLRVRVPLAGVRVPFTLNQEQAGRRLTLTLYGLETAPTLPAPLIDPLIAGAEIQPVGLRVVRLTLDLTAPQAWGFTANYDGEDLLLTVRRPPLLDPVRPLAGRLIVLDAGHGGSQLGGAGSLRVPEKDLTLPIARRTADLLRERGAQVILTRSADVALGLYERALIAEAVRADLLVSIHANALPDGRDPRGIRGPEVYFTHPQAQAPAAAILAALRRILPDLGPGAGLKPGADLALTRPTTQPSLLIETAYLTDPQNLRTLMDPAGRERFAQAIAAGIADFYAAQVAAR